MELLSIVVNVDSRVENSVNQQMFNGVVDRDFLIDGVLNKRKLFEGFEIEVIIFLDEHEKVSSETIEQMREISDTLIIRKHNKKFESNDNFPAFNDLNYLQSLFIARGKYIFHFDGDVASFAPNENWVNETIQLLEKYDYISYPSLWSPNPVHDESFGGKYWVSTRYFACRRSTLEFSEILKCQLDYDYWKETYPVPRLCHWTEHLLSSISHHKGKGVFYPLIDLNKFILFTWGNYQKGLLQILNNKPFEEVKDWVQKQNYHYPCDITINQ